MVRPGNSAFQADAFYPWRNNSIDIREGDHKAQHMDVFKPISLKIAKTWSSIINSEFLGEL